MVIFETTLLAILQGVAEFLPISSSGHLVIAQRFLGVDAPGLRLDVFLHVGTLLSIVIFYRVALWRMVAGREWRYAVKILLSAVPAVIVYFLFRQFIDSMFENARMVGALLMFTGAVLIGTRYIPSGKGAVSFARALLMGMGQALALLPGVSRSGMTLASARAGGVDPEKSAEFSFLMSAPLIIGAALLEVVDDLFSDYSSVLLNGRDEYSWSITIYGAVIAGIVGYFALKLLVKALKGRWFWLFGPYCLTAGLLTLLLV